MKYKMERENGEIIYLVYDGILTSSVFDSQVLCPLRELRKNKDTKINLIAFENLDIFITENSKLRKKSLGIASDKNIRVNFYPRTPGYIGIYANFLRLLIPIWCKVVLKKKVIIHSRGMKSAFIGSKLKKVLPSLKVLYDVRGVEPEEYLYSLHLKNGKILVKKKKKEFRRLKQMEKYSIGCADHIFSVSNEMRKHFLKSYNIEKKKMSIIPCGIDGSNFFFNEKARIIIRKKMSLENKLVFVYCGSMHPLQMPRIMVKLFNKFYKKDEEVFFLFLTKEMDKAKVLFEAELLPYKSYKVLSVSHSKIPVYLNAADIGLLLREKTMVNRVASPTKFAEYLACGLYAILSNDIGDASKLINEEKIGKIINVPFENGDVKRLINEILAKKTEIQSNKNKLRIAQIAQSKYNWNNLSLRFLETYSSLFKKDKFE